jgi:hypothetical protein
LRGRKKVILHDDLTRQESVPSSGVWWLGRRLLDHNAGLVVHERVAENAALCGVGYHQADVVVVDDIVGDVRPVRDLEHDASHQVAAALVFLDRGVVEVLVHPDAERVVIFHEVVPADKAVEVQNLDACRAPRAR